MINCKNCGAPIQPNSQQCPYCSVLVDQDLTHVHTYTVCKPDSERLCPKCREVMVTLDLKIDGTFYIERCEACLGLFFDPGELEAILDSSVKNVFCIDHSKLNQLQSATEWQKVRYVKCPVCTKIMNRHNFGHRSGVIVDECRDHGVFLEGGELKRLLGWNKAGGQLLHHQIKKEIQETEKKNQIKKKTLEYGEENYWGSSPQKKAPFPGLNQKDDLFSTLSKVLDHLFK